VSEKAWRGRGPGVRAKDRVRAALTDVPLDWVAWRVLDLR